jgi:hypothetical protein
LAFVLDAKDRGNLGQRGFLCTRSRRCSRPGARTLLAGGGELAGDVHVRFLEHLHAEDAAAFGLEFVKDDTQNTCCTNKTCEALHGKTTNSAKYLTPFLNDTNRASWPGM